MRNTLPLLFLLIMIVACKKKDASVNKKSYACFSEGADSFWHYDCYTNGYFAYTDTLRSITTDELQNYLLAHGRHDSLMYVSVVPCAGDTAYYHPDTVSYIRLSGCLEYNP